MKMSVATFHKADVKNVRRLADVEMLFDPSISSYSGKTPELSISGEEPVSIGAACTEPGRVFSITVLQNEENIFNIAGGLQNYAWAMLKLPSNNYLEVHIERNPVPRT